MRIIVGSKNPVKIDATKQAFSKYFDKITVYGVKIDSGVPAQPINEQTFKGAENRALKLKKMNEDMNWGADYFVGIEGGIINIYSKWFAFGAVCILDKDNKMGFGTSPYFELPNSIVDKLLKGIELGKVMDRITGQKNVKQKHGAIGFFTNGVMSRKELYTPGIIVALIPLTNNLFSNFRQTQCAEPDSR